MYLKTIFASANYYTFTTCSFRSYLLHPYRVALKIKADSHVLVVGVDSPSALHLSRPPVMLANLLRLIEAATASDILTAASHTDDFLHPVCYGSNIGEVIPPSIVSDRNHLLAATACNIWSSMLVAVLVEIRPTLCRPLHGSFAHVVCPLLALVVRNVTLHELPVDWIVAFPLMRNVKFPIFGIKGLTIYVIHYFGEFLNFMQRYMICTEYTND